MAKRPARSPPGCECGRNEGIYDQGEPCKQCRNKTKGSASKGGKSLTNRLDRVELLLERLCDGANVAIPYDDEEEDWCANDFDPEFGIKRVRLNPVDDAIYSSHVGRETVNPRFIDILERLVSKDLLTAYRESTATICLEVTQLGFNLYPLDEYEQIPKNVDLAKYIAQVRQVVVEDYDEMEAIVKRIIPKGEFNTLSPDFNGSTSAIYYGTICCVLSKVFEPANHWSDTSLRQVVRWAIINCTRRCLADALKPPSVDRLRAIVMLFMSGPELWIGIDAQNTLSRVATSLCSDLGLYRERAYMNCNAEQRCEWAALFWISYFINRTLSIRWGWVTSTETSDVSDGVVQLAYSMQVFYIGPAIELFRIYDSMYEFLSSGSAEVRSVRQLVLKSLQYLKELEDWWKRMYPNVSMSADPRIAAERSDQSIVDSSMRVTMRMGISLFLYLKISIFQSCTTTSASIKDHITAMYPGEVDALNQTGGVPESGLQSRIASLLSPALSLRRVSVQAIQICTAIMPMSQRDTCTKNLIDAVNFVGALLTAVLFTKTCTREEFRALKELVEAAREKFGATDMTMLKDLCGYIELHLNIIAEVTAVEASQGAAEEPAAHASISAQVWSARESFNDTFGNAAANQQVFENENLQLKTFIERGLTELFM